ncbi:MAG: sialate O-acetylesterase, partial [Verrucomicrobiota bacterium]
IISDHMVLQAGTIAPVWGWAEPGETVSVTVAGRTETVAAGADGRWSVRFAALKPSDQPQTLTVAGTNTLVVKDVLVGEVWLASGQSNMNRVVAAALNPQEEIAKATHPRLRMFIVKSAATVTPQADCVGTWQVCSPATVGKFSAVGYFFGRELLDKLAVPVGIVHSSVGGTDIAAWTSAEAQLKDADLKAALERWARDDASYDAATVAARYKQQVGDWEKAAATAKAAGKAAPAKPRVPFAPRDNPNRPANLYNGMIAPLIPYGLRGAIWYQGEHNCGREEAARLYYRQLPLLIADWRARWGSDFPFAWVQLPNFGKEDFRPLVREAMSQSLKVKNTGQAVTIDIGDPNDNHPKNKQEVGRRLGLWALGDVYGKKVPATSGPVFAGHTVRGRELTLRFTHAEGGLVAKGGELHSFQIAGADRKWKPAQARIAGETIVVSHAEIAAPVAVRYAFTNSPTATLYNGADLPASPFRTDDWPLR